MQNLWSELNSEQPSPGTAEHVQEPPRRRRLTEQYILSSLRDWLLQDFAAPYCRTLSASRIYRRCYWIDALGNIDSRSNSNILQPIISLAATLAQESKPIALHGIILEAGSSKRKETRPPVQDQQRENHHTAPSARIAGKLPKESGIVHASWLEAAPAILDLIDQSPAIFLLNPFGHILFTYDDLAPLYQRTAPTELCLLLSHKQLIAHLASAKDPQLSSTLTALLRSDRWKTLPTREEEMPRTIDSMIALLLASMQRHFLSVQPIALSVQVRPAFVETTPYTLIFATRRQDSLASMNDAVCIHRRRLYEQSHRGVLSEDWFATQQQERLAEDKQQLYQRILQQGRTQRIRRWPDLRQQLLAADFAHHTLQEYNEVMQQLLASGNVRCEWRHKPPEDSQSQEKPTPGNEDILLWK